MYLDQLQTLCDEMQLIGLETAVEVEESLLCAQRVEQIQKHHTGFHVASAFGGKGHLDQVFNS